MKDSSRRLKTAGVGSPPSDLRVVGAVMARCTWGQNKSAPQLCICFNIRRSASRTPGELARDEHMFSGMPLIAAGSEPAGTYVQRQVETSFSRDGLRHLDAPRPFTMI